ncbi:hypothetical protein [Schleiferilactobacillus perolens]|uniref:hypothetical protein n=1 Tax=Schleiferilactobacillus perolens TaxID=100468 RepID=UPI0039E92433
MMVRFLLDQDGYIYDYAPIVDGKCRLVVSKSTVDSDMPDGKFQRPKWMASNGGRASLKPNWTRLQH